MSTTRSVFFCIVLGAMVATTEAQEQRVERADVPEAVLKAVEAGYPDATLIQFEKEVKEGESTYEVGLESKGKQTEVTLSPAGRILAEEVTIDIADTPDAVRKSLSSSRHATAQVIQVEKVTETGKPSTYEIVVDQDGERRELSFTTTGEMEGDEALGNEESKLIHPSGNGLDSPS